ncbi:MAG: rod shape-determining protein RodA, partial [Candidatus Omnitrophota bacterium]
MSRDFDWSLLTIAVILSLFGIIAIYSATHYAQEPGIDYSSNFFSREANIWIKQLIWLLLSLMVSILVANFNYHNFWNLAWFLYILSLVLLILVLIVGDEKSGAKRWLDFAHVSFQPTELAKISIIFILAKFFTKQMSYHFSHNIYHSYLFVFLKTIALPVGLVLLPFILIIKQPDLGSALVLLPILFAILFCAGVPKRFIFGIVFIGLALLPFLWHLLRDYQKVRFLVFLNPDLDPLGAGYTITQSKIAIGSGQLLGKGWLSGTQNQLNFLPERHTDFIFSIIAEEWGFLGSILILSLYFLLVWRMIRISSKINDPFGRFICIGISVFLSFQILVNIAMACAMMPVVGLPLPFISYGGSFL